MKRFLSIIWLAKNEMRMMLINLHTVVRKWPLYTCLMPRALGVIIWDCRRLQKVFRLSEFPFAIFRVRRID